MKEPKLKTVYVCSNCGETSPRWMGRCPSCGSWNTMNEDVVAEAPKAGLSGGKAAAPVRQEGVTFVVTNSRTPSTPAQPSTPSGPSLPQTGTVWWPVGLLAICGAALLLAGLCCGKGKRDA